MFDVQNFEKYISMLLTMLIPQSLMCLFKDPSPNAVEFEGLDRSWLSLVHTT